MIAISKKFSNIRIILDGSTFKDCTPDRCVLVFCGTLPFVFEQNSFNDCIWEPAGAARNVIDMLAAMYRDGGNVMVESVFDAIRGSGVPIGPVN